MSSRFSIARRAWSMSQGKYWRALISRVTARASSKVMASAAGAMTRRRYSGSVVGPAADAMAFDEARAVTLEISALQYFPWLIDQARLAIEKRELMPGRYIRVRNIAEQSAPGED